MIIVLLKRSDEFLPFPKMFTPPRQILQGLVGYLRSKGVNNLVAIYISFLFFLGTVLGFFFYILPLVWRQLTSLIRDMPVIVTKLKKLVLKILMMPMLLL